MPTIEAIDEIVARDHSTPAPPDLAAVRAAGRRVQRRRRTTVGVAAAAVAAVVAVPLLVASGSQPSTAGLDVTTTRSPDVPAPTPATWQPAEGCAVFACDLYDPLTAPEGEVLGTPWDTGIAFAGGTETYWVDLVPGSDLADGTPAQVRAVELGLTRDGTLLTMARPMQMDRPDREIQWATTREADGSYRVLGYFRGTHEQVLVEGPGILQHPVTDLDTAMLPGYTFFLDTGVQPEVDGPGYDPSGLVFSTPDGTSCRVEDCAAPSGGF